MKSDEVLDFRQPGSRLFRGPTRAENAAIQPDDLYSPIWIDGDILAFALLRGVEGPPSKNGEVQQKDIVLATVSPKLTHDFFYPVTVMEIHIKQEYSSLTGGR